MPGISCGPSLPWIDDGTRLFGDAADRAGSAERCEAELARRRVRWARVSGIGGARLASALAAIVAAGLG